MDYNSILNIMDSKEETKYHLIYLIRCGDYNEAFNYIKNNIPECKEEDINNFIDKYKIILSNKYDTEESKLLNYVESQKLKNKPHCPTCGSDNIKKITASQKVVNTAMFGLFGTKRYKQFHCNNCGYEW